ncbi:MAG: hypothetical protein ACRDJC_24280 [Thermomicrobiales bacterium]
MATLAVQTASAAPLAACTVAPRPASEFVLPTDTGVAGGSLLIVDDEAQLPTGTPATAADVAAAQAFAELYTACQNAGDLRRLAALYTDAMFRGSLAERKSVRLPPENPLEALIAFLFDPAGADAAEEAAQLARDVGAPPTPLSPPIATAEVRDVRVLPDRRLGAVLVQDGQPREFQIYARVDGRIL